MSTVDIRQERNRRWRLALGPEAGKPEDDGLNKHDQAIDGALSKLYRPKGGEGEGESAGGKKGGRGRSGGAGSERSMPHAAEWLDDIRKLFPSPVVQVMQKDAFERHGLKDLLLDPKFIESLEPDVHLVAEIMGLRGKISGRAKDSARVVVAKVVKELMEKLEDRMIQAVRGSIDRSRRTRRPQFRDIDWNRTIRANLRHWQPELRTVIPETLIGYMRNQKQSDLEEVVMLVDQSGSMGPSVVYSSIFSAVMASLPTVKTQLVCFDTAVVDMTEQLADPVDVLFGIQLGGGTDIGKALAYCDSKITNPTKTHLVLISDLEENGSVDRMMANATTLVARGVNMICLLALSDEGKPASHEGNARQLAAMGIPVFACTPDIFPGMMAAALKGNDIADWAAANDVVVRRAVA